jgi:GT2 family glycosyltransferase
MNEIAVPHRLTTASDRAAADKAYREAALPALAGTNAVIVLGMHRSGTSALTGVLRHLGLVLGNRMMAASKDNPQGYWEHFDIVRVDDDLLHAVDRRWDDIRPMPEGWERSALALRAATRLQEILERDFAGIPLWGVKDPRLCRLMPLWLPLLDRLKVKPRFILVVRHPQEVAASLAARDGLSVAHSSLLWLRHLIEAERATRDHPRAILRYDDLVEGGGWRQSLARLSRDIGVDWPREGAAVEAAIDAYLAPALRHHRVPERAAPGEGWLDALYAAAVAGREPQLRERCAAIGAELDRAEPVFGALVGELARQLGDGRNRAAAQDRRLTELNESAARAEHEATELRALLSRKDLEIKDLKQSNMAVTAQGARLKQPLAVEDAYPTWIERRASAATARADWVAERVAQWPFMPKLALAVIVPAGSEERVALTLQSLMTQIVGTWELHVIAEGAMPAPFAAEKRLFWSSEGRAVGKLNQALAQSGAHWVALLDAGDQLAPHALFSVADAFFRHPEWSALYSDEDRIDPRGARASPHFKPDFNLDLMRSMPYVGGLLAVKRELFAAMGGFDARWEGTEEYDLALRLAERLGAAGLGHVADILYHRLTISGRSKRSIQEICADMPRVLAAHLERMGVKASAEAGTQPHFCRTVYHHDGPDPLVSIIVPTKNQIALLKRCVEAVLQKTEYQNYEVIVVDNGSTEEDACQFLRTIEEKTAEIGGRIRVLRHPGPFNFSAMNNRAVREAARGEYICLLNNDAAPLDGKWLGEMMMQARRPEVGAVGAKLFYPDGHIQHGGVILGVGWGSPADHPYNRDPGNSFGYWGRLQVVQDFSVVTAACLVSRRSVYEEVGGLDEEAFAVAYNDVDYCLKLRERGHLVVWTPYARLLHEASASLKSDVDGTAVREKNARFARERGAMFGRWMPRIAFDPAYNRNLSSFGFGFAVETEGGPTWDPEFRPRERVLVYPADREGCGEYRIIAPSRALFRAGVMHSYETMRLLSPPELARMAPDSIVFQRQLEWNQIDYIEQVKDTSKTFRIFEIDDLITNLPVKSAHRPSIAPDIAQRMKKAVSLCDRLVVSTEPLARQFGKFCDETVVLPNRLEKHRWLGITPKRRTDGKPRVGWAGAIGHLGDLSLIAGVVEATSKEVDWIFFGMCPDKLKPFVAEFHPWAQLHDYAKKLGALDLDLAVAPLEHNPFNEAKSNLRLLEYGMLGYPVICTDILPYQCGLPVQRVANRHRDWVKAIRDTAADREACRRAGEALRKAVLAEWMLEDHLEQWKKAWLR